MWDEGPSIAYTAMDANYLVQNILNELAGYLNIDLQCFTPVCCFQSISRSVVMELLEPKSKMAAGSQKFNALSFVSISPF